MLGASSPERQKRKPAPDPATTKDLLRESGKLLRAAAASRPLATSVPQPKSLSCFLDSFAPGRRSKDRPAVDDRLAAIREKPWAKHFTEDQLLAIASTQPRMSADGLQVSRERRNDWRRKLAGLMPKLHRPALDKLNNDLETRIKQQTPQPHFKKAPANWRGVTPKVEPIDEGFSDKDEDAVMSDAVDDREEPVAEGEPEGEEEPKTDEPLAPNPPSRPATLIIQSSDEGDGGEGGSEGEDGTNRMNGDKLKLKVQTDIKAFFGLPSTSVEDMRASAKQSLAERRRKRNEAKLRRMFFDEEAEESEESEESQDDDSADEAGMSQGKRARKKKLFDDEFVDEEEIRRELAASKFIAAEDHDSAEDHGDLTHVHNQLEMVRDAEALQLVVDRFARDKLDPKAHHLAKLANKYAANAGNDHECREFRQLHFRTDDEDDGGHLSDLIQADSDVGMSSPSSDIDDDYDDQDDDDGGDGVHSSSRPPSVLHLDHNTAHNRNNNGGDDDDDDDDVLNEPVDTLNHRRFSTRPMSFEDKLLGKLESAAASSSSLAKTQSVQRSGFTVGNSIAAD